MKGENSYFMKTYVAIIDGKATGTYIIEPNFIGLGLHVANSSYIITPKFRGAWN